MPINDPMAKNLIERARSGGKDPQSLLSMGEVFSEGLANSPRFVDHVRDYLESFYDKGARATLTSALSK